MKPTNRRAYFAYGSNTVREIMRARAPEASFVCSARLDGFRWIIAPCGYATVVPAAGRRVYGLLWCITRSDEYNLDLAEGVAIGGYAKRKRSVITCCGKEIMALVYETPSRRVGNRPVTGYVESILDALGSDEFIPSDYIAELLAWLR